ncbi:unnamed protein product [Lathyrus oleraceus]|uniref:Uncharacterized protein n=1 Tax=Pisum sativum TaxID=3888 RepID=A0A9D4ZXG7_PEA|nr:FK506-binding protein 4-like [Pisum sativum]KAI5385865.1 hypothetical protein KIW84_072458 [Pisum sativum]
MGNCGSNPKTDEGHESVPLPVPEVKVEHAVEEKSLNTLLNENVEEGKKPEEVKVEAEEVKAEPKKEEPKTEVLKVQEEKPKTDEAQLQAFFAKREG